MIKIVFKNGEYRKWLSKEYTDYKYDGKFFIIIISDTKHVFYNVDNIFSIAIEQ